MGYVKLKRSRMGRQGVAREIQGGGKLWLVDVVNDT